MDLTFPPEAQAFRERLRRFLRDNLPPGWAGIGALDKSERVIAAVNGAASGAGFSLALAAGIRLATPAARFNAAFVKIA